MEGGNLGILECRGFTDDDVFYLLLCDLEFYTIADAHEIGPVVSQFVQRIYHIHIDNGRIPSRQFVIQSQVWAAHRQHASTVPRHQHQQETKKVPGS